MRKAQKRVAEENKRKAVMLTVEKAELAVSDGKSFCISHVDVGLDVAAVREAVTKVIDQKVFADSEFIKYLAGTPALYWPCYLLSLMHKICFWSSYFVGVIVCPNMLLEFVLCVLGN